MSDQQKPFPFADLLGFSVASRGGGSSECEIELQQQHMNPHGIAHGGVVFSIVDTGMGAAVSSSLQAGEICSTIEIKINYMRPAIAGKLICLTNIVSKGKRTAVAESRVLDENQKEVCRALGTFMIIVT